MGRRPAAAAQSHAPDKAQRVPLLEPLVNERSKSLSSRELP